MCKQNSPVLSALCIGVAAISIFTATKFAHAHGEDKLGPHGGYIRMPGAFHTEVVPKNKFLEVYLLDINWKNPITTDSSLSLSIQQNGVKKVFDCTDAQNRFICQLPNGVNLDSGKLIVRSTRASAVGNEIEYALPLKTLSPSHARH
jgi:hypothetical protein